MITYGFDLTSNDVVTVFKNSKKDDWIAGNESDDAAYGSTKNLLISLWKHPKGFELRYGYQCVAIVSEPGGQVLFLASE